MERNPELRLSTLEHMHNSLPPIERNARLKQNYPSASASVRHRVLVFPCGSEIGLEFHRSVAWSTHFELFGASSVSSNHGRFVYRNYVDGLPNIDDVGAINAINKLASQYSIDLIVPAHDSVVLALATHQDQLHCRVVGSPSATCSVCRSKRKTYEVFDSVIDVPLMYDIGEFPENSKVFLKPDVGQGSKGTYIAESRADIEFYLAKDPTLLILEFLPGPEFTVDCFTDRHGVLRFVGPRERLRTSNGISVNTRSACDSRFAEIANLINGRLIFRGAWFFQVKEDSNGRLKLLEIAPRLAGAMGHHRSMGVNLGLLSLFDTLDQDVEILQNCFSVEMDQALRARYRFELNYDHVYVDLDDTLLLQGRVNVHLIAFLYQSLNRGIQTHLITRHAGSLAALLKRHRLDCLFDDVIHLTNGENKADHIASTKSILIDDSFAERKRVHVQTGIAVFDLDVVESLLDSQF